MIVAGFDIWDVAGRFSALQRAENSSMVCGIVWRYDSDGFSALQRAENSSITTRFCSTRLRNSCFSALQRAENSSILADTYRCDNERVVSVLFSEPKIPQSG